AAFLTFNAMRKADPESPYWEAAGTALVELVGCSLSKFGYPNDEAWRDIPRTRGLSYGIYEGKHSSWKEEVVRLNRYAFPKTEEWRGRHFLFLFHDSSFECLAEELRLEIVSAPYHEVFARIARRVVST